MADDTWNPHVVALLEAVYAAEQRGERPGPEQLAEATGLPVEVVKRETTTLIEGQYVDGTDADAVEDPFPSYYNFRMLEKGRRAIGQWPPGPGEAFVLELQRLIDATDDPNERTRLTWLRDAATQVGAGTVANVAVAAAQAMGAFG